MQSYPAPTHVPQDPRIGWPYLPASGTSAYRHSPTITSGAAGQPLLHEPYQTGTNIQIPSSASGDDRRRSSGALEHILQEIPHHLRSSPSSSASYISPHPRPYKEEERAPSLPTLPLELPDLLPRQARKVGQRKQPIDDISFEKSLPPVDTQAYHKPQTADLPQPTLTPLLVPKSAAVEPDIKPQSRSQRSMHISGLISGSVPSNQLVFGHDCMWPLLITARHNTDRYSIKVRQQPLAARACGFGDRDRRVIDPPPIIQLTLENPSLTREEISRKLKSPFSVVHCALWNACSDEDETTMPGVSDRRPQRRLMGTLVASPFVGRDENDVEGCFFCFPDLSCRTHGSYRLKFQLVVLDPEQFRPGSSFPILSVTMSDVFQVYNAKDFPGMRASTPLTKRLKEQGCLISVKKGNDKSNASRAREESEGEDDDDDDDAAEDSSVSGKMKGKRPKR
jgi:hypothetical protein